MRNLYNKITFDECWNIAEGFAAALTAMHNVYKKNNERKLVYPLIDLTFHTMEKVAYALLVINKGVYAGSHPKIRRDFIKEFSTHTAFRDMIKFYPKIYDSKDQLLYHFERSISGEKLTKYIKTVKKFKERAEFYVESKRGRK